MRIHADKSPLAGRTMRIKATARHHLYRDFAGSEFVVVDWADRIYGRSVHGWGYAPLDVIVFEARWGRFLAGFVPAGQDNEILIGRIKGNVVLVHITELEEPAAPDPSPPLPMAA